MKTKFIPLGVMALGLIAAGTVIASAQDASAPPEPGQPAASAPLHRMDFRGDKGARHGERGAGRHHSGHGRGGEMLHRLFGEVDADGDGSVTQEEIDSYRAAKVTEADTSGDGALSIEEFDTLYRAFTRPRMVDMFQEFDADGDGVISGTEMDDRFGGVVNRMDRDGDGALTLKDRGRRG